MLERYLEYLENRIDDKTENDLMQSWADFAEGRHKGGVFRPKRPAPLPETMPWPDIPINRTLEDDEGMALRQYAMCSAQLRDGTGNLLCVRANYGTGILPSLFGAEPFVMDEQYDTLPTSRPIPGGADGIKRLVSAGVPDLNGGYGEKVLGMGRLYKRIADTYPKIGRHVHVYHPDLQGPVDVCELLAGSGLFLMMVDEPALVHELLELVTETYIRFMREWLKLWGYGGRHSAHWGWLISGCVMLRNDSSMNLSPAMYEEFVLPCDRRLMEALGGGALHFCGRGDHYIGLASGLPGLSAVNFSQPVYNDMARILDNTVRKGIRLLGFDEREAPGVLEGLGELQALVHCGE